MPKLIFYDSNGNITRVMSSSLPKSKWNLSVYGLDEGEQMKLLRDNQLPEDFEQAKYLFDSNTFTKQLELEPPRDLLAELDDHETRLRALEKEA